MGTKSRDKVRGIKRREARRVVGDLKGAVRATYPGFIDPCRPRLKDHPPTNGYWIHEIKHDGFRLQAHIVSGKAILYTRRGYDWSEKFSSIAQEIQQFPASKLIVDGEVVVQNAAGISDFHELQKDLLSGRKDRLLYLAFDLLYMEGFDLRETPLITRRRVLAQLVNVTPENRHVRLSAHIEADAKSVFEKACVMGLEGIVSKKRDSPYRSGEYDAWIKVKCVKTDTFPIIAFVEKLGASPRRIASLYLGRWEGQSLLYAGKAQTGFKQDTLYELRERLDPYIRKTSPLSVPVKKPKATWVDPVLSAEVAFMLAPK